MQSWQIKTLELEESVLERLDAFLHDHALYFLIGAICLLLALLAWVLSGALRPKGGNPLQSTIIIHMSSTPPPPPEPIEPLPQSHECDCYHDYDYWED